MTTTLGIDLASQPKNTAIAVIRWGGGKPEVTMCARGKLGSTKLDDASLLELIGRPDEPDAPTKIAIDAPFGWPVAFVRAMPTRQRSVQPIPMDAARTSNGAPPTTGCTRFTRSSPCP